MRYKIEIEYDGTNYVGWQAQKDFPGLSVENILQEAIFKMTQNRVSINCAGRTDAGVHAIRQVADFAIDRKFDPERIITGLNQYLLGTDVVVINCEIVDDNFHSRFDAKIRSYRYIISNRHARPALRRDRVFHVARKLDVEAMKIAAKFLIGNHDFSAFRDSACQANTPIRTIYDINISVQNDEIFIEVEGKSFLHHMVRNMAGTLVWVGLGKISSQDVELILQSKDRTKSGPNAPACGLYFLGARY